MGAIRINKKQHKSRKSIYTAKWLQPIISKIKKVSRISANPLNLLVPEVGIEPTRGCPRGILSPVRLPISPLRQYLTIF